LTQARAVGQKQGSVPQIKCVENSETPPSRLSPFSRSSPMNVIRISIVFQGEFYIRTDSIVPFTGLGSGNRASQVGLGKLLTGERQIGV